MAAAAAVPINYYGDVSDSDIEGYAPAVSGSGAGEARAQPEPSQEESGPPKSHDDTAAGRSPRTAKQAGATKAAAMSATTSTSDRRRAELPGMPVKARKKWRRYCRPPKGPPGNQTGRRKERWLTAGENASGSPNRSVGSGRRVAANPRGRSGSAGRRDHSQAI